MSFSRGVVCIIRFNSQENRGFIVNQKRNLLKMFLLYEVTKKRSLLQIIVHNFRIISRFNRFITISSTFNYLLSVNPIINYVFSFLRFLLWYFKNPFDSLFLKSKLIVFIGVLFHKKIRRTLGNRRTLRKWPVYYKMP